MLILTLTLQSKVSFHRLYLEISLVRMRITVNGQVVLNNFEDGNPKDLYNHTTLNEEQLKQLVEDETNYTFTLDKYALPSVLIKVIKSMKRNEVCELVMKGQFDRLTSNFPN